jgi:hypothetical protein
MRKQAVFVFLGIVYFWLNRYADGAPPEIIGLPVASSPDA